MKVEKAIEIVKKLLAVANDKGATEGEAMTAALKAQEIMAKYDIDIIDVEGEKTTEEIGEEIVDTTLKGHFSTKWKSQLAGTIANNFRCKVYTCGPNTVIFYGRKSDAKIAGDVFKFLFHTGTKLGVKYSRQCKKEGKETRGAATTYLLGFCKGIDEVLGKQCKALMIITSPEVEEGWKEKSMFMRTKRVTYNTSADAAHYEQGRVDGRATANSRSLED